jgi:hypothetical protein
MHTWPSKLFGREGASDMPDYCLQGLLYYGLDRPLRNKKGKPYFRRIKKSG